MPLLQAENTLLVELSFHLRSSVNSLPSSRRPVNDGTGRTGRLLLTTLDRLCGPFNHRDRKTLSCKFGSEEYRQDPDKVVTLEEDKARIVPGRR
jgi:hypothetical protein